MARPTKYSPEVAASITQAVSRGATIRSAAQHVGIHDDTISRWCQSHAEFNAQLERAKQERRKIIRALNDEFLDVLVPEAKSALKRLAAARANGSQDIPQESDLRAVNRVISLLRYRSFV